jgi:CHAD domain-containing protein
LLQDILGEHHDAVVAKHHLLQLTKEAENAEESTFTYGMLYECELVTASHCSYQLADASRQALDDVRVISESPH